MAFGIDDAIAAGLKVLDKFVPDPEAKARAEKELRDSLLAADLGQIKVNEAEAQSDSIFVAGWRPAIGWICAVALGYTYIVVPFGIWVAQVKGLNIPKPPVLDDNLWELVMGMLGMAGLRTYEKFRRTT